MTSCVLCFRPIARRWWHWLIRPLPVCTGAASAACRHDLDEHARRARSA